MASQEIGELLALAHELRGVEFKAPGPRTNKPLFARVARAVLGMANHQHGGLVVIGVDDSASKLTPIGLSPEQVETWKYDDVADSLAVYADPSVSFELAVREYAGESYVVIQVYEFEDVPVLCKKDYQDAKGESILRKGACYVRSRRKPETSEIPSQEDMRDLLDLATEKRVRGFYAMAHTAGVMADGATRLSDEGLFNSQLAELM